MNSEVKKHPGVIAPPPLIYLAGLALAYFLNRQWPAPMLAESAADWIGAILIVLGLAFNIWGAFSLSRAKTPINPYKSVSAIVTNGAFRFSRNPLYVGITSVFLGLAFVLNTYWGVLTLIIVLVVMHFGVILREERYLKDHFGEDYLRYCREVRRYL